MHKGVLTVTQLNRYIAFRFKEDPQMKNMLIRGEISNFTRHIKSGHLYFTLKDPESSIKAVMFKAYAGELRFHPENGMDVIVSAGVQVFERDGVYQLYVNDMHPSGVGALYLAFEQLKEKLSAEGLFAPEHKKPIPAFPRKLGIITAPTGAALQDILNILSRRYPIVQVLVVPALVQGENAPASVVQALEYVQGTDCDVVILGRGGGSLEDLSSFNNEKVARAIYQSRIPVISAVGHETDVTIADFVADMRAPTPSAAAELAVPENEALLRMIGQFEKRLHQGAVNVLDFHERRLEALKARFSILSVEQKLEIASIRLKNCMNRMDKAMNQIISINESALEQKITQLGALDPYRVMQRGYSLVFKEELLVHASKELQPGNTLRIKLGHGEITAVVNEIIY